MSRVWVCSFWGGICFLFLIGDDVRRFPVCWKNFLVHGYFEEDLYISARLPEKNFRKTLGIGKTESNFWRIKFAFLTGPLVEVLFWSLFSGIPTFCCHKQLPSQLEINT